MKKLVLFLSFTLTGCFSDISDLEQHIAKVKENTSSYIEPMPAVPVYSSFNYSAKKLRSPFIAPRPEVIQEKIQQMSGCLSPDPRRRKQPLEKFALGDLVMRGTLGENGIQWALLEASDLTLHRVSEGNYLGLYNGRIIEIGSKNVTIIELTPDGAGCWVERETVIELAESDTQG